MDGGRAKRRRNWIIVALVAIGLPIVVYGGFLLAIARSFSGEY